MCGRYVRRSDKQRIADWFHVRGDVDGLAMPEADYNVAPTTNQPIIRQSRETGEREMVLARWGLVPFFTKSLTEIKGLSNINARADKLLASPTWREPMKKRRCLIPASGFYEWPQAGKPPKQPYIFELTSGNPFAIAGLWDALEGRSRALAPVVCHGDDRGERTHGEHPFPHSRHAPCPRLRPLAGSRRNRTAAARSAAAL